MEVVIQNNSSQIDLLGCFNGQFLPLSQLQIPSQDWTVRYGDGLFTTLRVQRGHPVNWPAHMQRLQNSATFFGYANPFPQKTITSWLMELIELNAISDCAMRLTLTRGSASFAELSKDNFGHSSLILEPRELPPSSEIGWRLCRANFPRSRHNPLTPHKTTNYAENLLALRQAHRQGFDEALFCVEHEIVQECTRANLFAVIAGELVTPAAVTALLPGLVRQWLLTSDQIPFKIREAEFTFSQLQTASEIFLTNSLIGILPVSALGDTPLPIGPITTDLQKLYLEQMLIL